MSKCMINKKGEMLEILQKDREPFDDEFKVPLAGYYECLNDHKYPATRYDFDLNDWVGVGEPIPTPSPKPNSDDYMLELDFRLSKLEMGV